MGYLILNSEEELGALNLTISATEAKDSAKFKVGEIGGMVWRLPPRRRKVKKPPIQPALILSFRLQENKDRARFRLALEVKATINLSEYGDRTKVKATRGGYPEDDELLMMLLAA